MKMQGPRSLTDISAGRQEMLFWSKMAKEQTEA